MAIKQGDPARLTYRYLRVAIVAVVLVLFVSLTMQIVADHGRLESGEEWWYATISSYFYSPVQSIFVGTLVGIGTCLIAIKGRHGAEEVLLNFAGMFAFAVALVPTPLDAEMCPGEPYCLDVPERVGNNMGSLLVVGGLVMLLSTWPRRRDLGSREGWDLWINWLTWAATGVWLLVWPGSFLTAAHYTAAILLFACLVAVAWINGTDHAVTAQALERLRGMSAAAYRVWYRWIAVVMATVLVVGLATTVVLDRYFPDLFPQTLFVVETVMMLIFVLFWVLQTIQFWDIDLPAGARVADVRLPGDTPV
ncbi:hypothetical protein C8K30_110234 [Promicromonospora sp. AC04]|uniref:hypothetical protein n=1 Tax=Promicromonospora sp. AC04 TaxID=2135723 RepID=UPI000D3A10A5|nr:hypothetical protein [Promicromonospora sp. AC04]PUB24089.1 hypothetical protein C8K30_110234 [Promicromonospora sp. AC04]